MLGLRFDMQKNRLNYKLILTSKIYSSGLGRSINEITVSVYQNQNHFGNGSKYFLFQYRCQRNKIITGDIVINFQTVVEKMNLWLLFHQRVDFAASMMGTFISCIDII